MTLRFLGFLMDKALDKLWPLEIRCHNYLSTLYGTTPPFEHDSVQLAADQLADAEAEIEVWEAENG